MVDNVYCIYDRLSNRYGSVFSSPSHATASRQFKSMFQGSQGVKESDYDLCHCGNLDISTGALHNVPTSRVNVSEYDSGNIVTDTEKELEKQA